MVEPVLLRRVREREGRVEDRILAFFAMQDELSELLGRKVDLNTPMCLSRYFRNEVLAEAEVVYADDQPE